MVYGDSLGVESSFRSASFWRSGGAFPLPADNPARPTRESLKSEDLRRSGVLFAVNSNLTRSRLFRRRVPKPPDCRALGNRAASARVFVFAIMVRVQYLIFEG